MPVVLGIVMPSAAVLVPEVGRGRERPAVKSIAACRRAGRAVAAAQVETLVLLTGCAGPRMLLWLPEGDAFARPFDDVEAPELVRQDRADAALAEAIGAALGPAGRRCTDSRAPTPSLPASYFLNSAGTAAILPAGIPDGGLEQAATLGRRLAPACVRADRRIGIVALGELSGRIFPGAPAGYHPAAPAFDAAVVNLVAARDLDGLRAISAAERAAAGEHLLPQLVTLLSATAGLSLDQPPVYEAPFGEGYLTTVFSTAGA